MSKNLFIGYNQNDFLYTKATQFTNSTTADATTTTTTTSTTTDTANDNTFSKSLPFPLSDDKCLMGFTNRQALIQDISNNLRFYVENINLGEVTASMATSSKRFKEILQKMKLTITSESAFVEGDGSQKSSNLMYDGSGTMATYIDSFGRPDASFNFLFNMPKQAMIPTANGSRYVSNTTGNPKCYYVDNCKQNHSHREKCTTQIYKNKDGSTYCKCRCTGKTVTNGDAHSHCEENSSPVDMTGGVSTSMQNAAGSIKEIRLSADPKIQSSIIPSGNVTQGGYIVTPDIKGQEIIELIADYYIALCNNKKKALQLQDLIKKNTSAGQLYSDANVAYSHQYQNMINISLSVLAVTGAFYYVVKNPPKTM